MGNRYTVALRTYFCLCSGDDVCLCVWDVHSQIKPLLVPQWLVLLFCTQTHTKKCKLSWFCFASIQWEAVHKLKLLPVLRTSYAMVCVCGLVCEGPRAAWHWYLASMAWLYTESWCHFFSLACIGRHWHPSSCWSMWVQHFNAINYSLLSYYSWCYWYSSLLPRFLFFPCSVSQNSIMYCQWLMRES